MLKSLIAGTLSLLLCWFVMLVIYVVISAYISKDMPPGQAIGWDLGSMGRSVYGLYFFLISATCFATGFRWGYLRATGSKKPGSF